jgi:4-carboxymuconolactone decarboxylase
VSDSELYEAGLAVRRAVLGADYVDQAIESASEFSGALQELVTEYCWGAIWTRPGLDRKTRSLLNLGMLSALRQWQEFALHVNGALTNGATPAEIQETLLQVTIYCGVPAGVEAFRVANKILTERGIASLDALPATSA